MSAYLSVKPEEHTLYVSTPAKDLIPFHKHSLVVATTSCPVPRIRHLPDNYRIIWQDDEKENIPPEMSHDTNDSKKLTAQTSKKVSVKTPKKPLRKSSKLNPSKKRKRQVSTSSESSAEEKVLLKTQSQEDSSSSEDDVEKNRVYIGSSSSEDEDFNMYYE